jgi:carboxyl-terminal processing protease
VSRDYRVESARPAFSGPLAVLVDRGSASASEILAGALQDHDRGVLVGDTTYGKGVAQQIYPLRGSQGAVQITVSRYRTPSGRTLHRERTAATFDPESEEEGGEEVAPAPEVRDTARTWRTAAGRVVRGGRGLEPEAAVVADSSALRLRTDSRHPGGPAGAARAALAVDPVFQRALAIVRGAADTRAVFAAAGAPLPGAPPKRR